MICSLSMNYLFYCSIVFCSLFIGTDHDLLRKYLWEWTLMMSRLLWNLWCYGPKYWWSAQLNFVLDLEGLQSPLITSLDYVKTLWLSFMIVSYSSCAYEYLMSQITILERCSKRWLPFIIYHSLVKICIFFRSVNCDCWWRDNCHIYTFTCSLLCIPYP